MSAGSILAALLVLQQPAPTPAKRLGFTVPKAPWMMGVPADTFEVTRQSMKPDGTAAYFMLGNGSGGLVVSFWIEPAKECKTAVECRDRAWSAEKPRLKNAEGVAMSEVGQAAVVEYLVPTFGGVKLEEKNMHAYFVRDGYWIDFHLSKAVYRESDRARFIEFIRAIDFEPKK
ncbi:MAG TPA: hypothetical protein VMN82_14715 [Thermoanaerobaculia bacterium]|nr:hypothetical protein [Thermoanaerobaculia bacterium]